MSAELEVYMGRENAWHMLGTIKGRAFGEDDMRHDAPELLMSVEMQPTYTSVQGSWVETPRKACVVREDGVIVGEGVGKDTYGIVQQADAFEWGALMSDLAGFPLISAGTLRGGSQYFYTYDVGTVLAGDLPMDTFLTVASSHDGSLSLTALHSTIIVVCANTLAAALQNAKATTCIKHTANVGERMKAALDALKANVHHTTATVNVIEQLMGIQVREFNPLLDGVLPVVETPGRGMTMRANARSAVKELLRSPVTDGYANTGWAFVQAVNTYENWNQTVRGMKGRNEAVVRAERQFDTMLKGKQPLTEAATKAVLALV